MCDGKRVITISYDRLSPEALEAVITDFVTRDATDYGMTEVSLQRKIGQVRKQLTSDKAVIVFDESSRSCNIISTNDPLLRNHKR